MTETDDLPGNRRSQGGVVLTRLTVTISVADADRLRSIAGSSDVPNVSGVVRSILRSHFKSLDNAGPGDPKPETRWRWMSRAERLAAKRRRSSKASGGDVA